LNVDLLGLVIIDMSTSFYCSQFTNSEDNGETLKQKSISEVHSDRHFQIQQRKYRHGTMLTQAPVILSPVEKGVILPTPKPTSEHHAIQINGLYVALQETDYQGRQLEDEIEDSDPLASWYDKVGYPYVAQATVLYMEKDTKSDVVKGRRFVQYDVGFFYSV